MKPIYVPKYLDEPPKFLAWTYPQLLVVTGPFIFGLVFKQIFLGLLGSVLVCVMARKLKTLLEGSCILSALYWYLPSTRTFKTLPPSYIREYLG